MAEVTVLTCKIETMLLMYYEFCICCLSIRLLDFDNIFFFLLSVISGTYMVSCFVKTKKYFTISLVELVIFIRIIDLTMNISYNTALLFFYMILNPVDFSEFIVA